MQIWWSRWISLMLLSASCASCASCAANIGHLGNYKLGYEILSQDFLSCATVCAAHVTVEASCAHLPGVQIAVELNYLGYGFEFSLQCKNTIDCLERLECGLDNTASASPLFTLVPIMKAGLVARANVRRP